MSDQRRRWETLIDREALGEVLGEADVALVVAYEHEHPDCGRERALWGQALEILAQADPEAADEGGLDIDPGRLAELRAAALERVADGANSGPDQADQADQAEQADQADQQDQAEPDQPERHDWAPERQDRERAASGNSWGWAVLSAAALAVAGIGVGLLLRGSATSSQAPQAEADTAENRDSDRARRDRAPEPALRPVGERSPVSGAAWVLSSGPGGPSLAVLETGVSWSMPAGTRACLMWTGPTAVVCGEGATLELGEGGGERRVIVSRGLVVASLDPLAPGDHFVVETPLGTVRAVGTVFAVEVSEVEVEVAVLEGAVELRGEPEGVVAPVEMRAGEAGRLGGGQPGQLGQLGQLDRVAGRAPFARPCGGPGLGVRRRGIVAGLAEARWGLLVHPLRVHSLYH